jgi:hypothetical protein
MPCWKQLPAVRDTTVLKSPPRRTSVEPRTSIGFHYLGARRVTYQVQVSGGGFVLAQVDINGHMAPVIRWGRAQEDRRAAGNFSDEPGEANPRREGRERWNLSF